ncbi:MAG: hypothetical protein DRG11_02765 [Epsilonproteobacteria bacterium]|nr:MAG: hypothetical protein DRG11_02765 [Campylobacterota bacterium]
MYLSLLVVLLFVGCTPVSNQDEIHTQKFGQDSIKNTNKTPFGKFEPKNSTKYSKKSEVLNVANNMIQKKEIYRGGCWDYINEVFNRASRKGGKKITIYKSKPSGKYANISMFKPGDWLYFINLSYHNIQHSAIFVRWVDYKKKIALTISYPGENKKKPGRYRKYKLSKVYNIIRYVKY